MQYVSWSTGSNGDFSKKHIVDRNEKFGDYQLACGRIISGFPFVRWESDGVEIGTCNQCAKGVENGSVR